MARFNGYFVRRDILELLDKRQYLLEELKNPANFGDEDLTEQLAAVEDTLESIDMELEDLAEALAGDIRNTEMQAKAYSDEADIWKAKQIRADRRAKSEKDLLKYILKQSDVTKLQAGKFKVSIVNNGGKLPIEYNVSAPAELPEQFRTETTVYKADDVAIREFLDNGGESDLFHYGQRGQNLRIS